MELVFHILSPLGFPDESIFVVHIKFCHLAHSYAPSQHLGEIFYGSAQRKRKAGEFMVDLVIGKLCC